MSDTRYNFNNILVANTKLLIPMVNNGTIVSRQPDVLILNGKLNKCNSIKNVDSPLAACSSCCLQIENSEFRRRSTNLVPQQINQNECFANCGEKRTVNIELKAKSQLSGKIVILAVSRETNLIINNKTQPSLECKLKSSWSFIRFNPKLDQQQLQNFNKKQTYYSRFNNQQIPNINLQSMTIDVNENNKNEQISLSLEMQKVIRKNQHVVNKETLLVNEFLCFEKNNNNNIDNKIELNKEQVNIHLLALINRELPPINSTVNATATATSGPTSIASKTTLTPIKILNKFNYNNDQATIIKQKQYSDEKNSTENEVKEEISKDQSRKDSTEKFESSLDLNIKQNKRTISMLTTTTTTTIMPARTINLIESNSTDNNNNINEIEFNNSSSNMNQRMDSPLSIMTTLDANKFLSTSPISLLNNQQKSTTIIPSLQENQIKSINNNFLENNLSTSSLTKLGPIYLTELESIKLRLKSNNLLMFTVISSLIIFTYTLCLLIYLKTRSRRQQTNSISCSSNSSTNRIFKQNNDNNQIALIKTNNILSNQEQSNSNNHNDNKNNNNLEISEPFNLQMPSATRTRLEMMLGGTRKKNNRKKQRLSSTGRQLYNNNNNNYFDCCLANTINDNEIYSLNYDNHYSHCLPKNYLILSDSLQSNDNELYQDVPEFNPTHFLNQQLQQQHQYYHYTPIDFVKAIKDAATIAKSRFKTSSFKPHLNVIPESDLEYLQQTTPKEELELFASFLSQHFSETNEEDQQQQLSLESDCLSPEQMDSLVQEAMSNECSHINNQKIYDLPNYVHSSAHSFTHTHQDNLQQNISTLFSKPQINYDKNHSNGKTIRFASNPINERPFSRSKVLQKVRNNYDQNDLIGKTTIIPGRVE